MHFFRVYIIFILLFFAGIYTRSGQVQACSGSGAGQQPEALYSVHDCCRPQSPKGWQRAAHCASCTADACHCPVSLRTPALCARMDSVAPAVWALTGKDDYPALLSARLASGHYSCWLPPKL